MGEAPERRDEALLGSRPASATLPACPRSRTLCCAAFCQPSYCAVPLTNPEVQSCHRTMRTDLHRHVSSNGAPAR